MNCRYCEQPIESGKEARTLAYWNQTSFVCRADCKTNGERSEAIDCQTVDADCNDCKHFQRGQLIGGAPKSFSGHCAKLNKPTFAYPHFWSGKECFEHRRVI